MAKYFNKNLKHVRSILNVSQQQIADEIKVDRSSISRWEKGEIDTPLEAAINIANYFNIKYDCFFGKDLSKIKKEDLKIYSNND